MLDGVKDERERRRLTVQLGTPWALEDVQAVRGILDARDGLAMLGSRLPGHINVLQGPLLERVKSQIDTPLGARSDLFLYSLALVMGRLAAPWQLIRLAIKEVGGDNATRIAETPYAVAVDMVLDEIERRARELVTDLKSGRGIAVSALLKEVHDALRGIRSELDLPTESAWAKQLIAVRAEMSRMLSSEIELMAGRVRRLIRPRPSKEIAAGGKLDADEVVEVESLIGFLMTCRNYAGELAINEITQRVFNDLQKSLEAARTRCSTRFGNRPAASGRSVSRRSMRRYASATRCSARNMPRYSPKPPTWPRPANARRRRGPSRAIMRTLFAPERSGRDADRASRLSTITGECRYSMVGGVPYLSVTIFCHSAE
jgi:hypothetical protein